MKRDQELFTTTLAALGEVKILAQGKYALPARHIQRRGDNKSETYSSKRATASDDTTTSPTELQGGTRPTQNFLLHHNWHAIAPEASMEWHHASASARLSQLKRGKLPPERVLDLHGLTLDEVGDLLSRELPQWLAQGCRVIQLIHGKGNRNQPSIIKSHMPIWLTNHPAVLAFCSAGSRQGGSGSLLVLLRRQQ